MSPGGSTRVIAITLLIVCSAFCGITKVTAQQRCGPECGWGDVYDADEAESFSDTHNNEWKFAGNSVLNALVKDAIVGGKQLFITAASLNASAPGAVNGGEQSFRNNSSLNALADGAVSGGLQFFDSHSSLNALADGAVSGGIQIFESWSTLNASAPNAIKGGTQEFRSGSLLNADANGAIVGGEQIFYGWSQLNASAIGAISGGIQRFYADSVLNATVTGAVGSGELFFGDDSLLKLGAENALTSNVSITFGKGKVEDSGTGTLDLNGFDTEIGGIHSATQGAGTITNGGPNMARLTIDTSAHSEFSGVIMGQVGLQKEGAGTLTLWGDNSYSGQTHLIDGRIRLMHNNALGTSDVIVRPGQVLNVV